MSKGKSKTKPLLGRTTTIILSVTAFVVAVVGLLSQVQPLTGAIKASWCAVFDCQPRTAVTPPTTVSPPTDRPQVRPFAHPSFTTLDGEGAPSGTISNIKVTIIDNKGKQPDAYVAEWTWSGSGGSQKGSQTVIIDLKSANGGTLQSLKIGLDRSHCYYGGNNERHEGKLSVAASLVAGITVSVSRVEGRQGRC